MNKKATMAQWRQSYSQDIHNEPLDLMRLNYTISKETGIIIIKSSIEAKIFIYFFF